MEKFFNFTSELFHSQQSDLPTLKHKSECHFLAEKSLMASYSKLLFIAHDPFIIWFLTPKFYFLFITDFALPPYILQQAS